MEYLLIFLSVAVYGFVSAEIAQSWFPRPWDKVVPGILVAVWAGVYLVLLHVLYQDFPPAQLALNLLLFLAYGLFPRPFLFWLLGVCSLLGALGALVQALFVQLGRPLPLPFAGQPGFLVCCALASLLPLVLAWAWDRRQRELQVQSQLLAAARQAAAQEQTIQALSAAYTAQRTLTHDFRRHLCALGALLDQGQAGQARDYLQKLQQDQYNRPLLVNCRHPFLDGLLNQKAYAARQQGTDLHFELNDLSGVQLSPGDLTVVLGNLLDNALEACQRLPQDRPRWVRVKLLYSGEDRQLFLSVENTSLPVDVRGDTLPTAKEDPALHGFGLPNVFRVLRSQGADWVMEYDQGVFLVAVEWPQAGGREI